MENGKKTHYRGGSRKLRALPLGLGGFAALAVALLLGGAALSRSGTGPSPEGPGIFVASPDRSGQDVNRKLLDRLIDEQKYEEAAKEAARIRGEARRAGDEKLWAWALIREVQLRTALHGYETAVRFLKEEPWPNSTVPRAMLDLFYAGSLATYRAGYSWEIGSRERVESAGPVDLKAWTTDQINEEAWSALIRVWKDRESLAALKAKDFPDIWDPGDYPAGIRDTLRDSVVYLMARFLTDTSSWTPRQSNETWLLDLERLASPEPSDAGKAAAVLESADAHPLEKLRALLAEHEAWCRRSAGRPEGALEARLELFAALQASFSKEDDRALIRARLADSLASARKYPWWASGQALLAEFTRAEDAPDALVRARKIALEGAERLPELPRRPSVPPCRQEHRGPRFLRRDDGRGRARAPLRPLHAPEPRGRIPPGLSRRPRGAHPDLEGLQPLPAMGRSPGHPRKEPPGRGLEARPAGHARFPRPPDLC